MGWFAPRSFLEDLKNSPDHMSEGSVVLFFLRWVSPLVIAIGLVISLVDLIDGWIGMA